MARMTSGNMDLEQTDDNYPMISTLQYKDFGFCGKGEARRPF